MDVHLDAAGGGTFTFDQNRVLGDTPGLSVEVILGTAEELPDSDTVGCDYPAASALVESTVIILPLALCWAPARALLRIHPRSFPRLRPRELRPEQRTRSM